MQLLKNLPGLFSQSRLAELSEQPGQNAARVDWRSRKVDRAEAASAEDWVMTEPRGYQVHS